MGAPEFPFDLRREPTHPAQARLIRLSIAPWVCSIRDMDKRYIVNLTGAERAGLEAITRSRCSVLKRQRARLLLKADEGLTDEEIAEEVGVSRATAENVRKRCVLEGIEAVLDRKRQARPSRVPKLDGTAEARLVQLACSAPPDGRARWTLSLRSTTGLTTAVFLRSASMRRASNSSTTSAFR